MKTKNKPAARRAIVGKPGSNRLCKQCVNLGRFEKDQFVFEEKKKRPINAILHY